MELLSGSIIAIVILMLMILSLTFIYAENSKFRFWIIPCFSLVMFIVTFSGNFKFWWLMLLMIIIAVGLGYLQAFKPQSKPASEGHGTLYRGGWWYLLSWVILFAIEITVRHLFNSHSLSISGSSLAFTYFPIIRLSGRSIWLLWAMSFISSVTGSFRFTQKFK